MSSQTLTRSSSATSTLSKVVYVTRKLQADLFNLVDTYSQMTQNHAEKLISDLRILLDEEVIERIDLLWTYKNTNVVMGAYVYKVINAGSGLADERAGGIRYDSILQDCDFGVRIYRNSHWWAMSEADRKAIAAKCQIQWSPGESLDFSRGSVTSDRMYSNNGLGLDRGRFQSN
ncbi:hypothetical protein NA78x_002802 [Anatilimnocola sp. NA78]|uniref:HORMA-1 domain-containing protein n=1 Tax=Anatilimnocola sp. NA78 TaxID=3415683 RepID=UPI003CE5BD51